MTRTWLMAMLVLLFGCDKPQVEVKTNAPSPETNARAEYEFQERCGKSAAAWFKVRYGDGSESTKDSQTFSDFSNHYNRKLKKCFVRAVGSVIAKEGVSTWQQLHDVHENKQYGDFFRGHQGFVLCNIMQKPCTTDTEWDQLIKPYMED